MSRQQVAVTQESLTSVDLCDLFQVTTHGLEVRGKPSFEACERLWDSLLLMEKTIQFAIGDAWHYFEERWGERASQIVSDRVGWSLDTLRNYRWVSERVAPNRRRLDKLSFSHHQKVAQCAPREQEKWLTQAADDEPPWSVKRLTQAIKAGEDQVITCWVLVARFDNEKKRDLAQRELEARGAICTASEKRG